METNSNLSNLFYTFGICDPSRFNEINSYNRYLGRLHELKLELEDAIEECNEEIKKVEEEKKT